VRPTEGALAPIVPFHRSKNQTWPTRGTHTRTCTRIHTQTNSHTHTPRHAHIQTRIHALTCTRTRTRLHAQSHRSMHKHAHSPTQMCTRFLHLSPSLRTHSLRPAWHPLLQVNKIRELPQHPEVLITHTDAPELYVWNIDKQPNRIRGPVRRQLAASTPGISWERGSFVPQGPTPHVDDCFHGLTPASSPPKSLRAPLTGQEMAGRVGGGGRADGPRDARQRVALRARHQPVRGGGRGEGATQRGPVACRGAAPPFAVQPAYSRQPVAKEPRCRRRQLAQAALVLARVAAAGVPQH
jgi:hypothetical protein